MKTLPHIFDKNNQEWIQTESNNQEISVPYTLSIFSLNVLFDEWKGKAYKKHVVQSDKRYRTQFKRMQQMDSDIITLNEVTSNYIQLITQEKWVQENYYISEAAAEKMTGFGNLVLSKFPVSEMHLISLSRLNRAVVCIRIPFKNQNLLIAAVHLSAQKDNIERRQVQINELTAYLDEHFKSSDDKLITGDINFHTEEEKVPEGYTDLWKTVNPNEPGYTFDGTINKMMHHMWPLPALHGYSNDIQMRLDRVLIKSDNWKGKEMHVCMDEPVYESKGKTNTIKDLISIFGDVFGINLIRRPKHYLFPSDHFGLHTILVVSSMS
jgi:endonuclease/exonuclease/phosphatase family metal-dependent hydrolase